MKGANVPDGVIWDGTVAEMTFRNVNPVGKSPSSARPHLVCWFARRQVLQSRHSDM